MITATTSDGGLPSGGGAFAILRQVVDRLDRLTRWIVIAAMVVMTSLVIVQVIFRYGLSSAIDWSEEVARLAFVWAMFMAIPHGIRRGVHVGIDALVTLFPAMWQARVFRFSALLSAVLMAVVFRYALQVTIYTWPEMMPTLNLTAAAYYVAVLVAAIHSLLHLLLLAWGGPQTWNEGGAL